MNSRRRRASPKDGDETLGDNSNSEQADQTQARKKMCRSPRQPSIKIDPETSFQFSGRMQEKLFLTLDKGTDPQAHTAHMRSTQYRTAAEYNYGGTASCSSRPLPVNDNLTRNDTKTCVIVLDDTSDSAAETTASLKVRESKPITGLSSERGPVKVESPSQLSAEGDERPSEGDRGPKPQVTPPTRGASSPKREMLIDIDNFEDGEPQFQRVSLKEDRHFVTKWTLDDETLAQMPKAVQPSRIKTRLLPHQLQVSECGPSYIVAVRDCLDGHF